MNVKFPSFAALSASMVMVCVSGCAIAPQSSTADASAATERACKVVSVNPAKLASDPSKQTSLERAEARSALASSPYRLAKLNSPMGQNGVLEEILRDCN